MSSLLVTLHFPRRRVEPDVPPGSPRPVLVQPNSEKPQNSPSNVTSTKKERLEPPKQVLLLDPPMNLRKQKLTIGSSNEPRDSIEHPPAFVCTVRPSRPVFDGMARHREGRWVPGHLANSVRKEPNSRSRRLRCAPGSVAPTSVGVDVLRSHSKAWICLRNRKKCISKKGIHPKGK